MSKICAVSAHFGRPHLAKNLVESAELFGWPLFFVGEGQFNGNYNDCKLKPLLASLDTLEQGGYDSVVWVDGFDSVIARPIDELSSCWSMMQDFLAVGAIFSAEKNCFPEPELGRKYPQNKSPWRFLNAGGMLGSIPWLRSCLIDVIARNDPDDQRQLSREYALARREGMRLDTNCIVFQTMWGVNDGEVSVRTSEGLTNNLLWTSPYVLHFNGGTWRTPEGIALIDSYWKEIREWKHNRNL